MNIKLFIVGIIFTTVVALGSFFLITFYFSPQNADMLTLNLLFFSLFVGLIGLFTVIGYYVRRKKYRSRDPIGFFTVSFRQGALFSFLLTGSLLLRATVNFWWWGSLILLLLILALEFFFAEKQE